MDKGERGEQGVTGPEGVQGATGSKGNQGATGDPGPDTTGAKGETGMGVSSAMNFKTRAVFKPGVGVANFPQILRLMIYSISSQVRGFGMKNFSRKNRVIQRHRVVEKVTINYL